MKMIKTMMRKLKVLPQSKNIYSLLALKEKKSMKNEWKTWKNEFALHLWLHRTNETCFSFFIRQFHFLSKICLFLNFREACSQTDASATMKSMSPPHSVVKNYVRISLKGAQKVWTVFHFQKWDCKESKIQYQME